MHITVIEKLFNSVNSEIFGFGLFSSYSAKSHELNDVGSFHIVYYAPHKLLDSFYCPWNSMVVSLVVRSWVTFPYLLAKTGYELSWLCFWSCF